MDKITKEFEVTQEDGWWIASTPVVDRQNDRVLPMGLDIANYRKNPVMIWAHDYRSPFAVIGKAADVRVTEHDFRVKPEWREPTNDQDPMHIIKALIDNNLVRTLSIGFNPTEYSQNDFGGYDFTKAEILEVSVVPVPANQEALRLAAKGLGMEEKRELKMVWSCGYGHEHDTEEEARACIESHQDLQGVMTPVTNALEPTETKDDNTELSPEVPAPFVNQLKTFIDSVKHILEVRNV